MRASFRSARLHNGFRASAPDDYLDRALAAEHPTMAPRLSLCASTTPPAARSASPETGAGAAAAATDRGSPLHQGMLAALPDEHTCSICFNIRYHPARISEQCNHSFCRMCVFRCCAGAGKSGPRVSSCPLCRAPASEALDEVLLPSDVPYDHAFGRAVASEHGALYSAALAREAKEEEALRETVIPSVPLIMLPGTCARDDYGWPIRPRVKSTMTFIFSDEDALRTLATHKQQQVGVVFREASVHGGVIRGFLARPMCGSFLHGRRAGESCRPSYRAKVCATAFPLRLRARTWIARAHDAPRCCAQLAVLVREFHLIGKLRRDENGCMVGAVEVRQPM